MNVHTPKIRQVLESYSCGRISAEEAARRLGQDATVHDVVHQLREAGLPLPRQPREVELAELARARRLFEPGKV